MNINIEFFDKEPIENIVTCLNFKMDKVIFFGQKDGMTCEAKEITETALRDICDISDISFVELSMKDIDRVLQVITSTVQREEQQGGKCFFDLTGGADMALVAMGMYSASHNIPMHRYDIVEGELKILNTKAMRIDQCVESRQIPLTIDDLIRLHGGKVDYTMQKESKDNLSDPDTRRNVEKIWQIAGPNMRKWNGFSAALKTARQPGNKTDTEEISREKICKSVGIGRPLEDENAFMDYLNALRASGCIENLRKDSRWISFRYGSNTVRGCLLEAGCILELHTYYERVESGLYDGCKIGTHLKWGLNSRDEGYLVGNEIDVLLLRGYVLTFISCKGGDVDQMDLYELDTVASRFGGKYARRELVTANPLETHHDQRAEEMNITVICV